MASTNQKRWYEFLSLSLLLGLAAAIGALIFFSWLTDEVLEGDSVQFDEATRAAVHQLASPVMTAIMRFLSFVGSTIVLAIGTTIVVIWFATRKLGREAKLFAATMIGAALLNITLKLTFKRARPTPFFDLTPPETYSFPSGHSLASACFFGALAAILTARIKNEAPANDRVDRVFDDVSVDRLFANLSGRASHDRRDRGIFSGVDLDPGGEICGDAVGAQEETKARQDYMIQQDYAGFT